MKRPEKNKLIYTGANRIIMYAKQKSYNQAIEEYEKFLPNIKELEKIIGKVYAKLGCNGVDDIDLAKEIHKRLTSVQ